MLIIIFITMLLIVISICVGFYLIITRILIEKNPKKCYVFPYYNGDLGKPKKGSRIEKTDNGSRYAIKGKYLDVPITYPAIWFKKRITFFTDINGDLITSLNSVKGRDFKLSSGDKDDLNYELGTSGLILEAIKKMKGKNDAMLMIIALIIFLVGGAIGFGVGKLASPSKTITQIVTVNQTAPYQPQPQIQITPIQ